MTRAHAARGLAAAVAALSLFCCACSPIYVAKAAAGHARLLWRSRGIASALRDPGQPESLKDKLRLVLDIRQFAFGEMGLKKTRDYSTYSPVQGAVSYVVSACPRTSLEPYQWWFPVLGKVPYKGYFRREDALVEMRRMESRGFDARVGGVAAYKTPLWFADPLPSNTLDYAPGELAELIIHELAHGTLWFKDNVDFDEAAAVFIGRQGAMDFLSRRFGPDSAELKEYRQGLARDDAFAAAVGEIYDRLDALYSRAATREEKLSRRDEVFAWGRKHLEEIGQPLSEPLNNASVLAHRLYHYGLGDFSALHERNGRDWRKTIAALKALDRRDPFAALKRLAGT